MPNEKRPDLHYWIETLADLIDKEANPTPELYANFLDNPQIAFDIVDYLDDLDENQAINADSLYSASIFAFDICINQLHSLDDYGNKLANKTLTQLMNHMGKVIYAKKHSISFWLPILNAFYESQIPLVPALKDAFFELATQEEDITETEEVIHLDSIRDLLKELSDLSIYDIAENFFAQSYAMPSDFYIDLVIDLYNVQEGTEVALLTLLHPNAEVRDIVVNTLSTMMDSITLTSASLSRLQAIMYWYPESYYPQFNHWIKMQRKKGVVFNKEAFVPTVIKIQASEVDGSGSQGIFMHTHTNKTHRLCGILFKYGLGIKDAWMTPKVIGKEVKRYYREAFDDSVTLREVNQEYLVQLTQHFLAVTIENGNIPDLHLMEIQEALGMHLKPQKLDIEHLMDTLSVQISPFTEETLHTSLKRSKNWMRDKTFTDSWYMENPTIDKLVNRHCSFINGIKVCKYEDAKEAVFEEMESNRDQWIFHFLWLALWAKVCAKKNEKLWQDSFLIAYAIDKGYPLIDIPIMEGICKLTITNSVETMGERGTYLNKE